jgi:hypothetical protein
LATRAVIVAGLSAGFAAPVVAQNGAGASPDPLNPLAALAKTKLDAFTDKPLFDASRRLPPPIPIAAPLVMEPRRASIEPPPAVQVVGIIQGKNDVVLVRRDRQPKILMVTEGDRIDDWVVTILPTLGLRLRKGDRTVDFALVGSGNLPASAVSTVPAANAR